MFGSYNLYTKVILSPQDWLLTDFPCPLSGPVSVSKQQQHDKRSVLVSYMCYILAPLVRRRTCSRETGGIVRLHSTPACYEVQGCRPSFVAVNILPIAAGINWEQGWIAF